MVSFLKTASRESKKDDVINKRLATGVNCNWFVVFMIQDTVGAIQKLHCTRVCTIHGKFIPVYCNPWPVGQFARLRCPSEDLATLPIQLLSDNQERKNGQKRRKEGESQRSSREFISQIKMISQHECWENQQICQTWYACGPWIMLSEFWKSILYTCIYMPMQIAHHDFRMYTCALIRVPWFTMLKRVHNVCSNVQMCLSPDNMNIRTQHNSWKGLV